MPLHDRTRRPAPLALRRFALPPVQKTRLSNGLPLWLVEQHRTPQVVVSIVLESGSVMEVAGKSGTATLTAELLDSGTSSRDALGISESVEFLGATLSFRAGHDAAFGTLLTLERHLEEAIALFADVLVNPSFPDGEFERLRKQRLASLVQRRDRPGAVATNVFMRVVYGDAHPYGADPSGTEASVNGLTRDDICAFYSDHYAPHAATLIVVGDTTMDAIRPLLERELGHWKPAGNLIRPPLVHPGETPGQIFLIDRPGAPQSEIRIGRPALERSSPDYFIATVMNRVLGGQFSSRINMNLREKRGYTYGARSSFIFLKQPGPFMVSGAFTGARTADAVEQLLSEISLMRREGVSEEELEFSRKGLIGSFALSFETPFQIAGALQSIALYGLPDDYYEHYRDNLASVSLDAVRRVAGTTLEAAAMAVVIVADAGQTRGSLETLGRGPVVMLDSGGTLLT
jgi:zinc protease